MVVQGGGLWRVRQNIFWPFQQPGLSPAKEGTSLPPAWVTCSCGRGCAGVLVQLGHGYTVELSSNAGFQCFVRLAHTHPKSVIALPSLVWSVPRAGSEKAKIERARGRMNPLTPDYWCIYFFNHLWMGRAGQKHPSVQSCAQLEQQPESHLGLVLPACLLSLSCVRKF